MCCFLMSNIYLNSPVDFSVHSVFPKHRNRYLPVILLLPAEDYHCFDFDHFHQFWDLNEGSEVTGACACLCVCVLEVTELFCEVYEVAMFESVALPFFLLPLFDRQQECLANSHTVTAKTHTHTRIHTQVNLYFWEPSLTFFFPVPLNLNLNLILSWTAGTKS